MCFAMNDGARLGKSLQKMPTMLEIPVGQKLSALQKTQLEARLLRSLGPIICVRHPPAVDAVRIVGDRKAPTIVASACCELSSRRARILIEQALRELKNT
jgi:hypothetical protein